MERNRALQHVPYGIGVSRAAVHQFAGAQVERGVSAGLVELDERCTICSPHYHSYRRDGARSGRMFAVIGMNTGLAETNALEAA